MSTLELLHSKQKVDRFIPLRDPCADRHFKDLFRPSINNSENLVDLRRSILSFKPPKSAIVSSLDENFLPIEEEPFKKSKDNSIVIQNGHTQLIRASGFRNDYYNHLLDCRDENTIISILDNTPYLLDRKSSEMTALPAGASQGEELLTSVKFAKEGPTRLALGSELGLIRFLDLHSGRGEIYDLHTSRIGCLDWNPHSPFIIASGSKDKYIKIKDLRSPARYVSKFSGHSGEICGLAWNKSGSVLASGGNDNLVNVWDLRGPQIKKTEISSHKAAIRGLCWAPFRDNLLASGGGSGDMRILVHNTDKAKIVKEIATDSQICAISWDEETKALITGHGFSRYQVCVWDFESERFVYELLGHSNRVLSLVQAGSEGLVVSGSSDETVRVWDVRKILKGWNKKASLLTPVKIR